ncbi:hypothetical protein BUALT_Bualt14G0002700 [Buddleja alternifolia]|uniref:Uncharacterized protein n=1 Tax=Buddleja alternifolia TaxID=168488 RepID=A0AAV6WQR9_9LAMI|nr:hypothetical protein BUALT_Bualt14G0002700 [Buddleja alternifolia]
MAEAKLDPEPIADGSGGGGLGLFRLGGRPKVRVTSEYDSDSSVFLHKVSCKLLENIAAAKLKLSFLNNSKGEVTEPQISFTSKFFSLHYDVEESDALLKASYEIVPGLQFRAVHQVKARQGEVAMVADVAGPAYKFELSSAVPYIGMPRATLKFPLGEVSLEEKEEEEEEQQKRTLSVNAIVKSHILNGVCTAQYNQENLDLRYAFKVGDEDGKAKTAPMKMKVQFMLQVPQDDVKSSALMFRVKKRWDI